MVTTDENTIKLHTDKDGNIWYSKGVSTPQNSNKLVDTFLLSPVTHGMGLIFRMLGIAENSELISSLFIRYTKGEVRSIQVAGPNALVNPAVLDDPFATIAQLRCVTTAPSCGGWRHLSANDYPTYALVARLQRNKFLFDKTVETYLRLHPAYKALSFIPTLSPEFVAQLLVTIIDPRWYVLAQGGDTKSKIDLFCGLTPQTQKKVSNPAQLVARPRELRCQLVLSSWKTVDPAAVDHKKPENFLYRIWTNCGGGWRGDLRASQAFLRYAVGNWLEAIDRRPGKKDGLFAPDLFFKTPAEKESFLAHMQIKK